MTFSAKLLLLIELYILCFSFVLSATLSENTVINQENVVVEFMEILDDMQTTIGHLEATEVTMKEKIAALEKKLETYETLETEEETMDEYKEERTRDLQSTELISNEEVISYISKRAGPAHVAFSVYLNHPLRSLGNHQSVVFNKVLLNDGRGYSENTGIFNVPTTGVYLFSWAVTAKKFFDEHPYEVWVKLVINGNHQLGAVAESRNDTFDSQGSNSVVVQCTENDEVWISHYSLYPDLFGDENERTTSFTGVLLYRLM